MKCLLIETKDKRKFLTHEKNFVQLIEFSKTFNAEMSIVKIAQGEKELLNLEELALAICDQNYQKLQIEYELIETKLGVDKPNVQKVATKVNKYITDQFTKRMTVSLGDLKKKFKQHNLTDAALCNHVRRAKKQLETKGLSFVKISPGIYKAN